MIGEGVRAAIAGSCGQMRINEQLITKTESVILNFIASFSGTLECGDLSPL